MYSYHSQLYGCKSFLINVTTDNSTFSPLTAIDVAGHEMSHGVTSRTASLVYSGQSGGLNEATSDIFGTSVEFYANNPNDPGDYLIGEEIALRRLATKDPNTSGGKYLRNMAHPTYDGASVDNFSKYTSSLDVHYSSGIANNFFYLLSHLPRSFKNSYGFVVFKSNRKFIKSPYSTTTNDNCVCRTRQ